MTSSKMNKLLYLHTQMKMKIYVKCFDHGIENYNQDTLSHFSSNLRMSCNVSVIKLFSILHLQTSKSSGWVPVKGTPTLKLIIGVQSVITTKS